jgi:hypothetical protein
MTALAGSRLTDLLYQEISSRNQDKTCHKQENPYA